ALSGVDLKINPGITGLLGPNGAGKSTLIKLILGLVRPTSGSGTVLGHQLGKQGRQIRSLVGYMPEDDCYIPGMSGVEVVQFSACLAGIPNVESLRRSHEILDFCGMKLSHAMNRPMRNYSLGMRQRTKIAQAIAHDPELLILDEPFSGLDPVGRYEMSEFLKNWATQGKSLILASHILHEVEAVNPSFLLISGGRLLASGSPAEVREILTNAPSRIQIRSSNAKELAGILIANCEIDSVDFLEENVIALSTKNAGLVMRQVTKTAIEQNIEISEVTSTDDSLKTLFSTLLRIHRGEMNQAQGASR
ncbi:UNVERIFIED_CONTAM: hypothetical protein GTU68_000345, partial [Idotea baltica]|nr:hypothetical protein [Idotea baltica]